MHFAYFRTLISSLLLGLVLLSLSRLVFYYYFVPASSPLDWGNLYESLYIGIKFDLRFLLILHLPFILLGAWRHLSPYTSNLLRIIWRTYFLLIYLVAAFFVVLDFAHYAYLETRLDASVLRFAYNLDTSLSMIWQTYPVVSLTVGLLVFGSAVHLLASRLTRSNNALFLGVKQSFIAFPLVLLFLVSGLWGKLSWYPLRWSDAFYSPNHLASQLALNPALYFFDTLKNQQSPPDPELAREHYERMAGYLGVTNPDSQTLNYQRHYQYTSFAKKPNVIIVLLESFAWYKTGLSGNPFDPTPSFDALAKSGVSFTRYYAPHGGTARSVWALLTGLPDIEVNKTSSRNPLIVNQHTIVNAFEGYEKFYFIGGSASWANIRGLLASNIPNLKVYEEGSYQSPRMDVWGISDLHLFHEANMVLKSENEKPFFAIIQTSGNHRPYNIPEDNKGFTVRQEDESELARYGFRSLGDFNAMRFMDHSIGYFIQQAKKESYFNNTLFVFLADHGNMRHAEHLPDYIESLGLTEFQSPLVFYGPGLGVQPQQVNHVASQLDVLPSAAGFVSQSYINTTLGRNQFDLAGGSEQYAFTVTFSKLPNIGVISNDHYFTMYTDGSKKKLYELSSPNPEKNLINAKIDIAKSMEDMARAYFDTTNYMRYNNAPVNLQE